MNFKGIVPFDVQCNRVPQSIKVLEEAAELMNAVKHEPEDNQIYEFCDVLQALVNFADVCGWTEEEISIAYQRVFENNVKRGRYNREVNNGQEEGR